MGPYTENRRPYPFADTEFLDRVDPITLVIYARYQQQREMLRFLKTIAAWSVRGVTRVFQALVVKPLVRWHRKNVLRLHLTEMPDYLLKDIGIRRDQIGAVVSGNLERGASPLARATADGALGFFADKARQAGTPRTDTDMDKPLAA